PGGGGRRWGGASGRRRTLPRLPRRSDRPIHRACVGASADERGTSGGQPLERAWCGPPEIEGGLPVEPGLVGPADREAFLVKLGRSSVRIQERMSEQESLSVVRQRSQGWIFVAAIAYRTSARRQRKPRIRP